MKGVLISNLGSPDAPTPKAVGPYLRQFLMDPYVLDVPYPLRFFLVHALIVPKRSHESAHAYSRIWTDEGSPLVAYTRKITQALQAQISSEVCVDFAMRYGAPGLPEVLQKMLAQGVTDLSVMPLYPQHAWATNVSTEIECRRLLRKMNFKGSVRFLPAFYKDPSYIRACAEVYRKTLLQHQGFDFYLFSYHGIPERHLRHTDRSEKKDYCLKSSNCCARICDANRSCYKHHCWVNTELVISELGLPREKTGIAFQSRLGKDPWLRPFTDHELERLAKSGIRRLAVFCPSFVADCLETLEEIGMRGREDFIAAGGEDLVMIPSLNAEPVWIETLQQWIQNFLEVEG